MNQKPGFTGKPFVGSLVGAGASKPKTATTSSAAMAAAITSRQELRAKLGATVNPLPQKRSLQVGTSAVGTMSKKARIHAKPANLASIPGTSTSSGGVMDGGAVAMAPLLDVDETWKEHAVEVDVNSQNFAAAVSSQRERGKPIKRVVCAAIKAMLSASTIDNDFGLQIVKMVGQEELLLRNVSVLHALMSLLNHGGCSNKLTFELLEVVVTVLEKLDVWTASLVHYCLNDSLGSRVWVDRPQGSQLLQSILSYFGPLSFPQESSFVSAGLPYTYREPIVGVPKFQVAASSGAGSGTMDSVRMMVLAHFDKTIDGGQVSKNLLRTISLCTPMPEVRLLASRRLDAWLQNGKVQRQAMELLLFVGSNMRDLSGEEDRQAIGYLLKMRALKSKQVSGVFANFIKELVGGRPASLDRLISVLIDNEFATPLNKHPFNLQILNMVFGQSFERAAQALVKKLIERVHSNEAIKPAKLLLRDLMRSGARQIDFPFHVFSKALFSHFFTHYATRTTNLSRELLLNATMELAAILPLLAMSQQLKDCVQQRRNGGGMGTWSAAQSDCVSEFHARLRSFFEQVIVFLKFLSSTSPAVEGVRLLQACASLLYLDLNMETPAPPSLDSWPNEAEMNQLMRLVSEHPVDGSTICDLLGLLERVKIPAGNQLDVCEALTSRSRGQLTLLLPDSSQLMHRIFKLSLLAETSRDGKSLADTKLYWKGWLLTAVWLCVGGITSPASPLLKRFFDQWPTLRLMFAMCISRDFSFPPRKLDGRDGVEIAEDERRLKEAESKLAVERGAVPGSMCYHDLAGVVRQPPAWCIAKLREWNDELGMDLRLTRSRDPDILLQQLSNDQGESKAIGAALKLIRTDAAEVDNVPVECLCQLLMLDAQQRLNDDGSVESLSEELRSVIVSKLRDHLYSERSEPHSALTIISFFLNAMASALSGDRDASLRSLHQISLKTDEETEPLHGVWNLNALASIPQFSVIADDLCTALSKCCQVENEPDRVVHYIEFLSERVRSTNITDEIAVRLSSLAHSSSGSVHEALLKFYVCYMHTRTPSASTNDRKDSHSHLQRNIPTVSVPRVGGDGDVTIPAEVARAMLELLCDNTLGEEMEDVSVWNPCRDYLMDLWFPTRPLSCAPVSVALECGGNATSTELLSHNLRLRMLSSRDERIISAALTGVTEAEQALEFVQSFGLPECSCTQIISILAKVPLDGVERQTIARALPFIRAYAYRGVAGTRELLERLRQAGLMTESTKPVAANNIMPHPSQTEMAVEREERMVVPEKEVSTSELVQAFLKDAGVLQLDRKPSPSELQPVANSNAHLSAGEIVDRLANERHLNDVDISRLMHRHSLLRPEIFPTAEGGEDCEKEMKALFKRESSAILHLVSRIPFRCSSLTVRKLVNTLLNVFDDELIPALVLNFMDANVNNASASLRIAPTPSQCSNLMLYLAKEIGGMAVLPCEPEVEELAGTKQLLSVMRFVGSSEIRTRVIKAAEMIETELTSNGGGHEGPLGARMRRVVQMLIGVLKKHFPDPPRVRALTFMDDYTKDGSIEDFDRSLHRLISDLFGLISTSASLPTESDEKSDTEKLALETMRSILREADANKELMARQIPLLSTHLSSMVVQMTPRQLREQTSHVRYMETAIEVIVRAAPYSIIFDVECAERTLQVCIDFFKENAMRIRGWTHLMLSTIKATLRLAELGDEGRTDVFLRKNEGALREMGANFKDSADVQLLLLNLPRKNNV